MDEFYNKHYERINELGYVIHAFSDAFEQPLSTDILVDSQGDRHYNPILTDFHGCHLFRYIDGVKHEQTDAEKQVEFDTFPKPEPSPIEKLQTQIDDLTNTVVVSTMG